MVELGLWVTLPMPVMGSRRFIVRRHCCARAPALRHHSHTHEKENFSIFPKNTAVLLPVRRGDGVVYSVSPCN